MDRELKDREGAFLGPMTCEEMYEKLKVEGARLEPKWHPHDASNFVVTAWHLYDDWLKSAASRLAKSKRNPRNLPPEMVLVLQVFRDLANGSKHYQLKPDSAEKRIVESVHHGETHSWSSYFFRQDKPGVSVGQNYFGIRVLRNIVLRYFEWVFDDTASVKRFPPDLLEALRYCNIATRPGGASPALWLKGIEST